MTHTHAHDTRTHTHTRMQLRAHSHRHSPDRPDRCIDPAAVCSPAPLQWSPLMRAWTTPASTSLHSLQLLHVWLRLSQQWQCRSTPRIHGISMVTRPSTPAMSQRAKKMTLAQCRRVRFFSCSPPVLPCRRRRLSHLRIGVGGCSSSPSVYRSPVVGVFRLWPSCLGPVNLPNLTNRAGPAPV